MRFSKWRYYARSILLMLFGVKNWTSLAPALITKRGRIIRLDGLRFFYRDAMDVWTIKETCLDDHYRVTGRPVAARGVVIDIGAGLGDFAIMVAKRHPQARVLAFEPFPESAALCRRNVALNAAANISLIECAVGGSSGTASLDISSPESVQYSTVSGAGSSSVAVQKRTLAEVFAEHGIDRCDLLKLDCEGAEFEILLTLDPALIARIEGISLEYHDGAGGHNHQELMAALGRAGYRLAQVTNPVHAHLGYLYAYRP
ncbi:MAG: FkbM family methyltransferase [Chloroflexales bacterium]|nr:FkbM family methyltransferase [Chloroflexales bacterium]